MLFEHQLSCHFCKGHISHYLYFQTHFYDMFEEKDSDWCITAGLCSVRTIARMWKSRRQCRKSGEQSPPAGPVAEPRWGLWGCRAPRSWEAFKIHLAGVQWWHLFFAQRGGQSGLSPHLNLLVHSCWRLHTDRYSNRSVSEHATDTDILTGFVLSHVCLSGVHNLSVDVADILAVVWQSVARQQW